MPDAFRLSDSTRIACLDSVSSLAATRSRRAGSSVAAGHPSRSTGTGAPRAVASSASASVIGAVWRLRTPPSVASMTMRPFASSSAKSTSNWLRYAAICSSV